MQIWETEKNPGDQREGKCRFGKQLINCLAAKWDDSCLAAVAVADNLVLW